MASARRDRVQLCSLAPHRGATRKSGVKPLDEIEEHPASAPRALPWADMLQACSLPKNGNASMAIAAEKKHPLKKILDTAGAKMDI